MIAATALAPRAVAGFVAPMTLLFVLGIRELGSSLFLYTSNTTVMAVLLLDYYEGGNTGKTAAFSLVQTVLLAVLIGGAHLIKWLAARRSHMKLSSLIEDVIAPHRNRRMIG